jgi:hypothetical protein
MVIVPLAIAVLTFAEVRIGVFLHRVSNGNHRGGIARVVISIGRPRR